MKRCNNCGTVLQDNEKFCTTCGANMTSVPSEPAYTQVPPPPPMSQQGYYQQPQQMYQVPMTPPPYGMPQNEPMSLGKWVGTIIVTTCLGIISIIFLFIWGFGEGPEPRKTYCKAMLIVYAIMIGVSILLSIMCFGLFASVFSNLAQR